MYGLQVGRGTERAGTRRQHGVGSTCEQREMMSASRLFTQSSRSCPRSLPQPARVETMTYERISEIGFEIRDERCKFECAARTAVIALIYCC